jgi:hypothetical protein
VFRDGSRLARGGAPLAVRLTDDAFALDYLKERYGVAYLIFRPTVGSPLWVARHRDTGKTLRAGDPVELMRQIEDDKNARDPWRTL